MAESKTGAEKGSSSASAVLEELSSKALLGREKELEKLSNFVRSALEGKKSDSVLLLGPRGSGKTSLVGEVIKDLSAAPGFDAFIVRLSGLEHRDDRLALKEMAKQMRLDDVVGDRMFISSAAHLNFLLKYVKSGEGEGASPKPILLVLDEFDRFCVRGDSDPFAGRVRKRRPVFDVFNCSSGSESDSDFDTDSDFGDSSLKFIDAVIACQSVPIISIGVSANFEKGETMMKRIKSDLLERVITIYAEREFETALSLARHFLSSKNASASWNEAVENLLKSTERDLFAILFSVINHVRSAGVIKQFIRLALQHCVDKHIDEIDLDCFKAAYKGLDLNFDESVLDGLEALDLILLIACRHLHGLRDDGCFNFVMAQKMYLHFTGRETIMWMNRDKSWLLKSWKELLNMKLIVPTDSNARGPKEKRDCKLGIEARNIDRFVLKPENGFPKDIRIWASQSPEL